MDDSTLLLVEAGLIRGEDATGLVTGTVAAVTRTEGGVVAARPGDTQPAPGGRTTTSGCVSYLFDRLPEGVAVPSGLGLRTTDDGWLASHRPPEWEVGEWADLLTGKLGPWAMLTDAAGVVSLCHSARLTGGGAEAGVFTATPHRGRGLAKVVTSAWARLAWDRQVPLFYSHAEDNGASRRVAEGLGLRRLERVWFVSRSEPNV
jgi:GNAT superfamily N-acetyltransferase